MKKSFFSVGSALVFLFLISTPGSAETLRVATKENAIREDCKFFAPVRAKVKLDDELSVVSRQGDWVKVKFNNVSGCIHKSAVSEKSVSFGSAFDSGRRSASQEDVTLAGKGFNPQVEKAYRSGHPNMDYTSVDNIERYTLSETNFFNFITQGGLNQPK